MKGVGNMISKLKQIAAKFPDHVAAALFQEAQIEATEMKRRCPVDTTDDAPHPGLLRNGIHVEPPVRSGRKISVMIATSAATPYDIYVHENPDAFHPVGQWKFMESVLNESQPHMGDRVAQRVHFNQMKADS